MALDLIERPRRNRKSPWIRDMSRETWLGAAHFIYPLFVHEGAGSVPIPSMPGCQRHDFDSLLREVEAARGDGVGAVVLFPKVPDALKSNDGREAYNPNGLVPRVIAAIKAHWPDMTVVTDVALDPYSTEGHDGIVSADGRVLNDETVQVLVQQALCQAAAGADIISPSDMMDGRVGAIRAGLDAAGHTDVSVLAYTAKYASAWYGPFRDALDSAPKFGDKKTYQMDPANGDEALREVELDIAEGADSVMVKPGLPYLDIVRRVHEAFAVPVFAYQVSGEYAMIEAAAAAGAGDREALVMETLLGFRRAGAAGVLTYHAPLAARLLNG